MKLFKRTVSLAVALVLLLSCVYTGAVKVDAATVDTYIASCTTYPASLSVKTTEVAELMTYPCSSSTQSASTAKTTVAANTMLTVTALYKNTAGEYWYKVLYYNVTLYVKATKTQLVDHLTGDVTVSDMLSPGSLSSGDAFSIGGTITSSLNKLGNITAAMYWGNDLTIDPVISASASASGNTYTLNGSSIDSGMSFGSLDTGVYTYVVTADAHSYYIDANDALAESVKSIVVEHQRCIVTDYTNPNDITGWGVDVSVWNGSIDWSLAKNDLDFAILRSSFEETTDNRFYEYAAGCEEYGIPFGVYVYSYADNVAEAEAEARHAVSLVKDYEMMQLPIFFDAEDEVLANLGITQLREVTKAFINVVREAGYDAGIYTNISWFNYYYDTDDFHSVAKWLAQIDGYYGGYTNSYNGGLHFWQYSWEGSCSGIYSTGLDVNYSYDLLPGQTNDTTYRSKCTAYPSNLTVTTTGSTTVRKYPCNTSVDSSSTSMTTVSANTQLHVTALYKNTSGEYWYQVETSSGCGYIPASSATVAKFLYDDLAVVNPSMTSNLSVGASYNLSGFVTSQYNDLSAVHAKVYSGEDTQASPVISGSGTPRKNEYYLVYSQVDSNLSFGSLSSGYYTYEISADVKNYYVSNGTLTSKNENVVVWTAPFTVGGASINMPASACNHANVVNVAGKAATCTTAGYTASSYCSKCGMTVTESSVIPATGHKYTSTNIAGNCQEYAHTSYTCTTCGNSYNTFSDSITSAWQTTKPSGISDDLIETKTQYRYSDYQTTTSYATSLSGYTQIGGEWVQSGSGTVSYVKNWPSGFRTSNSLYTKYNNTPKTASETTTTKTVVNSNALAGYLYYHWCYTDSYYSLESSSGSYTTFHAYYDTTSPSNYTCDTSDMSYKTSHSTCSNSNWFFVAEVYDQTYTTYNKLFTYERWTDYSAWSDSVYTASDTRKVETRTMYRYVTASLGEHNYVNGVCTICGAEDANAVKDYYLFGYINGADYACEGDYANLGEYKFVNGKLTATFTQDSYVAVKSGDNLNWYMTNGWLGTNVTSATLYNTTTLSSADKLFVPGGVAVTFTLVDNGNDTFTLSCAYDLPTPVITPKYPSLSFEGEIFYNIYYAVENLGSLSVADMGLMTWSSAPSNGTIDNAEAVIPGAVLESNGYYSVHSNGIPAKNLADTLYFKVYAKLADGSYVYSNMYNYSAKAYALDRLANSTNTSMKALCVAMLNYGAAAQTHFNYKSYNLMNSSLTAAQKALVSSYNSSMIASLTGVSSSKIGAFAYNSAGYTSRYPSVSFEGAFAINYYFTPALSVDNGMTLYYWNLNDYASATVLTTSNATGKIAMTYNGTNYEAAVSGIAAKEIDQTVFVAGVYSSGGVSYATGVLPYSLGAYCLDRINNGSGTMQSLASATAVYGYYAKQYFFGTT